MLNSHRPTPTARRRAPAHRPLFVLAITILATTAGCNSSDTTQPSIVASVTIAGPSTVRVGQTIRLTATAADANNVAVTGQTFTWSSGNETVASVASDGTVTGKVAGSATISASVSSVSGSANITVTP
jgi:alpha-amylase